MNFQKKTKAQVALVLSFTLLMSICIEFDMPKQNAGSDISDTESTLVAGTLSNVSGDAYSLTAGTLSSVNTYSQVSVSDTDSYVSTGTLVEIEDEYPEGTVYGYYNLGFSQVNGNLNVREDPSSDGHIVGKLTNNNAVEIVSTSDDGEWYQITSGNVEGWVSSEYIVTGDEALAMVDDLITTYATVNTSTLRVRSEPNTDCSVLELVNDSDDLAVVSVYSDEWIEVEVDDGDGYVSTDYVTLTNKFLTGRTLEEIRYGEGVSDVRISLVEYALQFVGNPYVWGGTSLTNGVDCSGFTMKVYAYFGISLPHSSRAQPSYGTKISASEAQPGDLFFYGSGSHINHVAIYIGNGQVVHASNHRDGIKISNCYYRTPICVVSYLD